MTDVLPADVEAFVRTVGPAPDAVLEEMHEYAVDQGFPHVGPEVGATLRLVARMVGAERVFEFGSGYGYSAYWLAEALPDDGELVLTEVDADELELAREYLERGGFADLARFERGDAIAIAERYDGPFDVVLVDVDKPQYPDAFHAIREKVAPGGVIVADNAITAGDDVDFETLAAIVGGDAVDDVDEHTFGIAEYLGLVRSDPAFETIVLPLGEGISLSYRLE